MRFLTLILLASIATATMPANAQISAPPVRKSIAILSTLGDRAVGVNIGTTVFQNDQDTLDADLGIDAYMTDQLAAALRERYDIKEIAYDRPTLLGEAGKREVLSPTGSLRDALRKSIAPGTVDLIFVVRSSQMKDPFSSLNLYYSGYGTYVHDFLFFGRANGVAFLICTMVVIDGHRMETLNEYICSNDGGIGDPRVPYRKLDKPMSKARINEFSAGQQATLRETLRSMVAETVPLTLAKLKLVEIENPKPASERPQQEESTR